MKKKIRDLTDEEADKLCKNRKSCRGCPLADELLRCIYMRLDDEVELDESNR